MKTQTKIKPKRADYQPINQQLIYVNNEFKNVLLGELPNYELITLHDGLFADVNSCDLYYCGAVVWLKNTDAPNGIVFNDMDELWALEDDVVYGHYGRRDIGYFSVNEDHYIYNDDYYHESALLSHDLVIIDGEVYSRDDCHYCEDLGDYRHADDCYYCDDDDLYYSDERNIPVPALKGYHQSKIDDKSEGSLFKIGFEIEKEDNNFRDFGPVRDCGWDAESDSSLDSETGFELVSAVYNLMDMEILKADLHELQNFIHADTSDACGGHINVSEVGKSAKDMYDSIRGYLPLLYAMYPNRLENTYCKAKKDEDNSNRYRYQAINLTKGHILEFRIFSAVKSASQLYFRASLIQYMFKNKRKGAASVIKMLLSESELKAHLLTVYNSDNYSKLLDRVVRFTDIYMSLKDAKTTAKLILKSKGGEVCV